MAAGPTDPHLALKITPPRIPRTVLERPRLSSTRPEFADKAVIALQAAAGSGKTSLLAQWRKEALQSGAVVAWLTVDGRDTDNRLVLGLAAAMRSASGRPNFGQASARAADLSEGSLEGLTEWLAEVADLAVDTVLVLDDVHALAEQTVNSSLAYLLLNAPSNLKLILASRKPLALPVADLPARGRFAALTARELLFDLPETIALLQARFGARIDLDSCVRLHEITEGWPLGLQLAISTIERSPDLQEAIAGLSVRSGDLQRYFVQSLVDRLPPAVASFLVRVSFVHALSPALCEAITADGRSAEMLAQLRELTPIFAEGVDSEWLRIHPLAREFLLAAFAQLPEQERRELRVRAAGWLDEHGQSEEAARQMFEAGLVDEAYALLERSLYGVLLAGHVSRVTDWLERLPREEVARRTSLRLVYGWILAQSERHAEAAQLAGPIIEDRAASLGDRCEGAEICATAALFADDLDGMARIISPWSESLRTFTPLQQLVGLNQLAFTKLYRGAPDQARYGYREQPTDGAAIGRYTLGWRDWVIGMSYLWEGQVQNAAERLRVALDRAEDDTGRRSPTAVMLASALAMAQWERDATDDAAALLANRLDVLERRAPPDAIIMGYVVAARVAALGKAEQRALDLLDHLFAIGQARQLPRLCVASLGERMRMHARRDRGDLCAIIERKLDDIADGLEAHPDGILGPVIALQIGLARTYAASARHDWRKALELCAELFPLAERLRRARDAVQLYLLRALATDRCGRDSAKLCDEAASICRMWGLARIATDTHADLPDLLRQSAADVGTEHRATAPAAEAQQERKPAAATPQATRLRAPRGSLLSPREREVLRLLAANLSNKQIALAMGVTDETVKWHFKNLFRKLDAVSRSHLLHRARMVGVIEPAAG
jgi:LuxR family maltose regulon positive regulatory protein